MTLRVGVANVGEGAFEAELWVQLPDGSFYQRALSHTRVRDSGGGVGCGGGHRVWGGGIGYVVRTWGVGWGRGVWGGDIWYGTMAQVWDGDSGYGAVTLSMGRWHQVWDGYTGYGVVTSGMGR